MTSDDTQTSNSNDNMQMVTVNDTRNITEESLPQATIPIITAVAVEKPLAPSPVPYTPTMVIPQAVQRATNAVYTSLSLITVVIAAIAILVFSGWFIWDITHIPATPNGVDSTLFFRNQVIKGIANFLANMTLVLVLVEVLTALILFIRNHYASVRPILLIPLFIVMRGIILMSNDLIINPPSDDNGVFTKHMIQLGAFGLIGIFIALALAVVKDPMPARQSEEK
jgi:uncharacterized membrane protein (DUF373 family)